MKQRRAFGLYLNVTLVLATSLLGLVSNYATDGDGGPWFLALLRSIAFPAFIVIVVALIVGQIFIYRMENPPIPRPHWDRSRIPYPGLEPYRQADSAVFFGREEQVSDIVRTILHQPERYEERFLPVVGASGSGKSSLVLAGVLPVLQSRRWTVVPTFTPGINPFGNLAQSLSVTSGGAVSPEAILRSLRNGTQTLADHVARVRQAKAGRFSKVLIYMDQLEELFTLAGENDRERFLKAVDDLLRTDSRVWIIVSLRIEFLQQFLAANNPALFQRPVAIGAIQDEYLTTVIEEPGRIANMSFAPGLVQRIADDVGTSDALPLLAYLLQELYFEVGSGGTVTLEKYLSFGGVGGALTRQADQAVMELQRIAGIESVLATLLRFVSLDARDATRRPVAVDQFTEKQRLVVDAFVEARLLVTNVKDGQVVAEVAHEALFRLWAPLRQEVEARAELLRQRSEFERWAADWNNSGRSKDYLLTGQRLTLAQQWLANLESFDQATDDIRLFIDNSKRQDVAFLRRVSENIAEYVLANAERFPELSILLSLAALSEAPVTPLIQRALMSALTFSHARSSLTGHSDTVRAIAWSRDGRFIATASRDSTARIWDAASGQSAAILAGHAAMAETVAWAPDSRTLATGSRDRTVKIWEVGTNDLVRTLHNVGGMIRSVTWSPDGSQIAAGSQDHNVYIWNANTGDVDAVLRGHQGDVHGLGWSADGQTFASVSHDRTVIIWDLPQRIPRLVLSGHTDFVQGFAWSPDGTKVASASGDQTVRVWDSNDGRQELIIRGHTDAAWSVAWSPDGLALASASSDKTIRVWDARDGRELATLRGHDDTVWGAVWSPDGSQLASCSTDRSARLWSLLPQGTEERAVSAHSGGVRSAAWSKSGSHVVSGGDDGVVRLWETQTGRLRVISEHAGTVWGVAWSSDGRRVASCSNDQKIRVRDVRSPGDTVQVIDNSVISEWVSWSPDNKRLAVADRDNTVSIWDVDESRRVLQISGHDDWVVRVAWSPSGRRLATTSDDRTARVWDASTGAELAIMRGHQNFVDGVAWAPDESRIVTCSADWTVRIWDASSGRQLSTLNGHEGRVRTVDWSPDGRSIVSGSYDRTVRVWDVETGEEARLIGVHADRVTSVAWSSDGQSVLSASMDTSLRIWPALPSIDEIRRLAQQRVFRELSPDERNAHMLQALDSRALP